MKTITSEEAKEMSKGLAIYAGQKLKGFAGGLARTTGNIGVAAYHGVKGITKTAINAVPVATLTTEKLAEQAISFDNSMSKLIEEGDALGIQTFDGAKERIQETIQSVQEKAKAFKERLSKEKTVNQSSEPEQAQNIEVHQEEAEASEEQTAQTTEAEAEASEEHQDEEKTVVQSSELTQAAQAATV